MSDTHSIISTIGTLIIVLLSFVLIFSIVQEERQILLSQKKEIGTHYPFCTESALNKHFREVIQFKPAGGVVSE